MGAFMSFSLKVYDFNVLNDFSINGLMRSSNVAKPSLIFPQ